MALKSQDIKELTKEELIEKIKEEKLNYKKLQFNHAISDLDNPMVLRTLRRDIARLKTELSDREINAENA